MNTRQLVGGDPVPEDNSHTELKANGQQRDYVVLSEAERAKGFVKPLRTSYIHKGRPTPRHPLRDLTQEERAQYGAFGYEKYEAYPEGGAIVGRFWTTQDLERIDKGCGVVTRMARSIAETYARDPFFYSSTFCLGCGTHIDLVEFLWEPDGEPMSPSLWTDEEQGRVLKLRNK